MITFKHTPRVCDTCNHPFEAAPGTLMYDAAVYGTWGCICLTCFDIFGCKLGVGFGQKYERQIDGTFLLVEGGSNAV